MSLQETGRKCVFKDKGTCLSGRGPFVAFFKTVPAWLNGKIVYIYLFSIGLFFNISSLAQFLLIGGISKKLKILEKSPN